VKAAFMMCHVKNKNHKRNYKVGTRKYAILREAYSKTVSRQFKGKKKPPITNAHRTALSIAAKNREPKTTEQKKLQSETVKAKFSGPGGIKLRAAISAALIGRSKSPEHIAKVGASNKDRKYVINPITKQVKKVKGDKLQELLNNGWLLGRIYKQITNDHECI
jgi:hypothetical protein